MIEELFVPKRMLNPFVLNVRKLAQGSELLQSGSGSMRATDMPTNVAPVSATSDDDIYDFKSVDLCDTVAAILFDNSIVYS
jgi:hypothetical protein